MTAKTDKVSDKGRTVARHTIRRSAHGRERDVPWLLTGIVFGWLWFTQLPCSAQVPPRFTRIQFQPNKELLLTLSGSTGVNYRLETSTNVLDWNPFLTVFSTGATHHVDTATPYIPSRFYRAQQLIGTNNLTGDHLVTTNGDVVFHPVGHATFVMSWNGLTIYNDPTNGTIPYQNFARPDLILVSHNHPDHFSASTLDALRVPNTIIIMPPTMTNSLSAALRAVTIGLSNNAAVDRLGLRIEAVPAYNSFHTRGECNAYVLTIGGKRIFMSGDTGDTLEMRGLQNIDVAFVCMNLPFTMDVTNAAQVVRAFRPKVIYPYHFRNSGGVLGDLNYFKRQVSNDLAIEVRIRKWY